MNRTLLLASVAILATSASARAGQIRLCAGAGDPSPSAYTRVAEVIASFAAPTSPIEVVTGTGGTGTREAGNVERTLYRSKDDPQACDAMIGQPDGIAFLKRQDPAAAGRLRPVTTMHKEYAQLVCGKDAGIADLADLEGDDTRSIALGAAGSGAWLFWQNVIAEDPDYDAVRVSPAEGADALSQAATGGVTCVLRTAGLHDPVIVEADDLFGDDLRLVPVEDDKDFNDAVDVDGSPLYFWDEIPDQTYPVLQGDGWGSDAVPTISWRAKVYVNVDRVKGPDLNAFIGAVAKARKSVVPALGG